MKNIVRGKIYSEVYKQRVAEDVTQITLQIIPQ
jgi:CTP synthase (UTP-ammonia lyase)